jgi:hypothetical protein
VLFVSQRALKGEREGLSYEVALKQEHTKEMGIETRAECAYNDTKAADTSRLMLHEYMNETRI